MGIKEKPNRSEGVEELPTQNPNRAGPGAIARREFRAKAVVVVGGAKPRIENLLKEWDSSSGPKMLVVRHAVEAIRRSLGGGGGVSNDVFCEMYQRVTQCTSKKEVMGTAMALGLFFGKGGVLTRVKRQADLVDMVKEAGRKRRANFHQAEKIDAWRNAHPGSNLTRAQIAGQVGAVFDHGKVARISTNKASRRDNKGKEDAPERDTEFDDLVSSDAKALMEREHAVNMSKANALDLFVKEKRGVAGADEWAKGKKKAKNRAVTPTRNSHEQVSPQGGDGSGSAGQTVDRRAVIAPSGGGAGRAARNPRDSAIASSHGEITEGDDMPKKMSNEDHVKRGERREEDRAIAEEIADAGVESTDREDAAVPSKPGYVVVRSDQHRPDCPDELVYQWIEAEDGQVLTNDQIADYPPRYASWLTSGMDISRGDEPTAAGYQEILMALYYGHRAVTVHLVKSVGVVHGSTVEDRRIFLNRKAELESSGVIYAMRRDVVSVTYPLMLLSRETLVRIAHIIAIKIPVLGCYRAAMERVGAMQPAGHHVLIGLVVSIIITISSLMRLWAWGLEVVLLFFGLPQMKCVRAPTLEVDYILNCQAMHTVNDLDHFRARLPTVMKTHNVDYQRHEMVAQVLLAEARLNSAKKHDRPNRARHQ